MALYVAQLSQAHSVGWAAGQQCSCRTVLFCHLQCHTASRDMGWNRHKYGGPRTPLSSTVGEIRCAAWIRPPASFEALGARKVVMLLVSVQS